jgi:hypothetical protein
VCLNELSLFHHEPHCPVICGLIAIKALIFLFVSISYINSVMVHPELHSLIFTDQTTTTHPFRNNSLIQKPRCVHYFEAGSANWCSKTILYCKQSSLLLG